MLGSQKMASAQEENCDHLMVAVTTFLVNTAALKE